MIVRSYNGSSMDDALEKVRNDLGSAALIIETRAVREPGLLGRRVGYEVVAAGDPQGNQNHASEASDWQKEVISSLARKETTSGDDRRSTALAEAAALATAEVKAPENQAAALQQARSQLPPQDDLGRELDAIRRQLARLASGQDTPTRHLGMNLADKLEDYELPAEIIAELDEAVAKAGDRLPDDRRNEFCIRYLEQQLHCPGDIDWDSCQQLLLVGPTGVGKTTTLAKIAGDLVLRRRRRIAMVTIDTYRVGASDQLRTYADLLDVPCEVARSPAELSEVLARLQHVDNVLIDTAGRSPTDTTRLHELRSFAKASAQLTTMLAIDATCGRAEFAAVIERFSILPIQHTVVTKIDECVAPGRLLGCLRRHHLPVNYITDGQEVPQDIHIADAHGLASQVLRDNAGTQAA